MAFGGFLKQSTAVTLKLGPFVDATDGFTVEAALTITSAELKLSKNGGALTAKNEATSLSYDANGFYDCPLDTTDTNTLGILTVAPVDTAVANRPFSTEYLVVPANVYDALVSGTVYLKVDLTQVVTAAVNTATAQLGVNMVSGAAGAITASVIANDAITTAEFASALITAIADEVASVLGGATHSGAVVAGASGTVTLAAGASAVDDKYKVIVIKSAAGVVQFAYVSAYNGTTKVATISPAWVTVPDTTYQYIAFGQ